MKLVIVVDLVEVNKYHGRNVGKLFYREKSLKTSCHYLIILIPGTFSYPSQPLGPPLILYHSMIWAVSPRIPLSNGHITISSVRTSSCVMIHISVNRIARDEPQWPHASLCLD